MICIFAFQSISWNLLGYETVSWCLPFLLLFFKTFFQLAVRLLFKKP